MKRSLIPAAVIAATFLCGSLAGADNKAGVFAITPFIGGYTFDGKQEIEPSFIYGLRAGYNITDSIGVEGVMDYGKTETDLTNADTKIFNYRLEALYHFCTDKTFVPFIASGYGGSRLKLDGLDAMNAGAFDYGLGAKYFISDNMALRGDFRNIVIDRGPTVYNYEYTLGLSFLFGGEKAAPAAAQAPKAAAPLPAPATTLTVSPATIAKGEAATLSWTSQNTSSCDIQPGIGAVQTSGSKSIMPADTTDYTLTCSGDGGLSSSRAGINVTQKAAAAEPAPETLCIELNIEFDTDKAEIKPQYHNEIAKAGDFMKQNPSATAVIEGHTDNVGEAEYNMKLSKKRADNVVAYLVKHFGIESSRLTAKGFGQTRNIADNNTPEGRQKNRRINAIIDCVIKK